MHRREAAATEPYTWSNFEFYEKNGFKWVKSATAIEPFGGIRYDAEKLFLAAYFADVVFELSDEKSAAGPILPLCLNALHVLSTTTGEDERIKAVFELRAAALSGFCPDLSHCQRCGSELEGEENYLDVMNGALLCGRCLSDATALTPLAEVGELGERRVLCPLTLAAATAISFVVTADPKRVFSFRLTDEQSAGLFARAAEAYLLHHLERGFPSLENYRRLCSFRRQAARQ